MQTDTQHILSRLPYKPPFLFVDTIHRVDEGQIEGSFHLKPDLDFYKGHFEHYPITPGVILTEIMAQISLACHGLYLAGTAQEDGHFPFVLTASAVSFYKPVYPDETVRVLGEKQYFRFGKLKSKAKMYNAGGEMICEGTLEGIRVKERIWNEG